MEQVTSYAQENEDIILYHMLKDVKEVKYIDIGANDPIDLSVTKFFSIRGGSGINIEPQKNYIRRLKKDRPKDINLAVGVSNKCGTLKMSGRGTTGSFEKHLKTVSKWEGEYEVPVVTLRDICREYIPEEQDIHFLKIDVEGWEKECIEGADFKKWRPWILCIEAVEPGTNIPKWHEWENILFENNYCYAGMQGPDRYYVSEEHKKLAFNFLDAEEIKEIYSINQFRYDKKTERRIHNRDNVEFLLSHPLVTAKVITGKIRKKLL